MRMDIEFLTYHTHRQSNFLSACGGQRRKNYLKEYQRGLYDGLLLTGKLYQHLSAIDEQAQKRYDVIVEQMKKPRESPIYLNLKFYPSGFRK
ncbi:MAG: TnpV protein [Clostridiales bacterium]|nr:TnpV protein [Clostridiales bacterium]